MQIEIQTIGLVAAIGTRRFESRVSVAQKPPAPVSALTMGVRRLIRHQRTTPCQIARNNDIINPVAVPIYNCACLVHHPERRFRAPMRLNTRTATDWRDRNRFGDGKQLHLPTHEQTEPGKPIELAPHGLKCSATPSRTLSAESPTCFALEKPFHLRIKCMVKNQDQAW